MANFSKIALAMAAPAAALAMSALPASALVYQFTGNFGSSNGGVFSGSFDYNGTTDLFGPISITTPTSLSFLSVTYGNGSGSATSDLNFTFVNGTSTLFFTTASALAQSNPLGVPIALGGQVFTRGESQDDGANGFATRNIISGSVTPVPFEFSPVYGVALLGLGFGVSKIKNKFAKKAA